ncbi:Flagellar motor-switch protein [Helicobacter sp. NHP19-003]|uniref:Flagellar motor-switch protein n=1 Tax=Helicobacter gastrocanis TaxID=2849641 RepID=A0ABN6I1M2_9HELI|nr:YhcH/YjgK/YiaL family protein [Helicobacter sp. NHP19-003]BCZ17475.1 Flagellar motor-switch protein [Helicobacter sp. NHP19-003]
MAVIGKLDSLAGLFSKTQELENLYTYLKQICDPKHPACQALLQRQASSMVKELGSGMCAIEIVYSPELGTLETHKECIDFLLVVMGGEILHLADKTDLSVLTPYNLDKDQETYQHNSLCYSVPLHAGMLVILFPHDAHTTEAHKPGLVYKVVVKVPINLVKFKL